MVQMEMNDDSWHMVKETPRVMGFIGGTADKHGNHITEQRSPGYTRSR